MLAYVFWHRPAAGVEIASYEQALTRFHGSLAQRPPSGFLGSVSLRAQELPWLDGAPRAGYEDWYTLESWSALGVLESAAVSRGHQSAHQEAARRSCNGAGAVYKHLVGALQPRFARLAVWVSRPSRQSEPTIAELLDDGIAPARGSLWQRTLVLGPAPELCMLIGEAELPVGSGLAPSRLPVGWSASPSAREALAP